MKNNKPRYAAPLCRCGLLRSLPLPFHLSMKAPPFDDTGNTTHTLHARLRLGLFHVTRYTCTRSVREGDTIVEDERCSFLWRLPPPFTKATSFEKRLFTLRYPHTPLPRHCTVGCTAFLLVAIRYEKEISFSFLILHFAHRLVTVTENRLSFPTFHLVESGGSRFPHTTAPRPGRRLSAPVRCSPRFKDDVLPSHAHTPLRVLRIVSGARPRLQIMKAHRSHTEGRRFTAMKAGFLLCRACGLS